MGNVTKISSCRMCGNSNLVTVVDIGNQFLTGIFPRTIDKEGFTCGPLKLVKCHGSGDVCGLLQLEHSYDLGELYGEHYGYRSGLNPSMVQHLQGKISSILQRTSLKKGDLVIDIGSNDGTTLAQYPDDLLLVGIDPTGKKFKSFYKPHIHLIPDFFSANLVTQQFPGKKAKVITSFSMFYDLERPLDFALEIARILDPQEGLWIFEQSYMPLMLERDSFDTICHEHLEYYGLKQIVWLADKAGLKIVDVELNDVNGGSFSVVASPKGSRYAESTQTVHDLLQKEEALRLSELTPYQEFEKRIDTACEALKTFIRTAKKNGKRVCGLGASTKGNVLLQYCQFSVDDIEAIAEVNEDKFGCFTPGTWIPIKPQSEVLASKPDYLIVLPWHFREFFVKNPSFRGHTLVFPLPTLQVVSL